MKRKFTASAIYVVMLLLIFIDPIYAVTMNDLPVHEIYIAEKEKKVLDSLLKEASVFTVQVPISTNEVSVSIIQTATLTKEVDISEVQTHVQSKDVHVPVALKKSITSKPEYTEKEIDLLERLVHAEAEGEPFNGKVAVANVVLNRVKSSKFPNSIETVIYAHTQFSSIWDGRINNVPSEESKQAVLSALEGYSVIPADVAFFYEPTTADTHWVARSKKYYGKIGQHKFYYE